MATVVMNMSGYDMELETPSHEEYGEEIMQSGWNPQLGQVIVQPTAERRRTIIDAGLVNADIDAFLLKMYRSQR